MAVDGENRKMRITGLSRFASLVFFAAVLSGLAVSFILFFTLRQWDQARFSSVFDRECQQTISALRQGVYSHLYPLESLRGLYKAFGGVSRQQFALFVKDFQLRCPGLQAIEWIPRVPSAERKQYETRALEDGLPEFRITEIGKNGHLVAASERDEYYPVYYVEPYLANEPALGFDLASETVRRETLDLARDVGRLTMSPPVLLVQGKGGQQGLLVFVPVYEKGSGPDTVAARKENIVGFFVAVLRVEDFLRCVLSDLGMSGIELYVYHQSSQGINGLVFFHASTNPAVADGKPRSESEIVAGPHHSESITFGARQWLLLLAPTPGQAAEYRTWLPWAALAAGVLFTILMTTYIYQVLQGAGRAKDHAAQQAAAKKSLEQEMARRKATEHDLRVSERRYRTLFESATDAILIMEAQGPVAGKIVEANSMAAKMHGYTIEEILSLSIQDLDAPESARNAPERFNRLRKGEVLREELLHRAKDGRVFPMEINARLIELAGRQYVLAMDRDISDRKTREAELRQRDYQQRAILENIPDMAWLKDKQGRFIAVNGPFARACGFGIEELSGKTDLDIWPSEIAELYIADDREAMSSGTSKRVEEPFADREGRIKWVETIKTPIFDDAHNVIGITAIARDITERKKAREALRESEERYRLLVEMSPDGIAVYQEGKLVFGNLAAAEMFGFKTRGELMGSSFQDIIHPQDWKETENRIQHLMQGETVMLPYELSLLRHDGTPFPAEVTALPMTYGGRPALQVIVRDLSQRRRTEQTLLETARRLRLAVEAANVGLWDWDLHTNEVYYSPELKRQIGFEDHEISNELSEWGGRIHPDDLGQALKRIRDYLQNPWPDYVNQFRLRHKDGSYRWISAQGSLLHDEKGKPARLLGCHLDITEHVLALEKLREREDMLEQMSRIARIGAWEYDVFTRKGKWTEEVDRIRETDPGEEVSLDYGLSFYRGESRQVLEAAVNRAVKEGKPYDIELEMVTAKGNQRWVRTIGHAVRRGDRIVKVQGTLQDITDQVKMEESLRESEKKYRTLFEQSAEAIFISLPDGRIVDANQACSELFGVPRNEIVGEKVWEFLAEEDSTSGIFRYEMKRAGFVRDFEIKVRRKDGSLRSCLLNCSKWKDDYGSLIGYLSVIRDITEQKLAREAQLRLAAAIEQSAESVVITDAQRLIQYTNPAFEKITGYSRDEVIGRHPLFLGTDAHEKTYSDTLEEIIMKGEIWTGRLIGRRKDGEHFHEDATISPVRDASGNITNFVEIGQDVTERIRLEGQLFQAQKMESIGTLAGGIAHDFNNLLTVIQGYSELLLAAADESAPEYADLQAIHLAATRGADLVQSILTFSRRIESQPRPIDLNEEVRHAGKLLNRTLPKMIDIQLDLADDLSLVYADPGQVEQVLLNLAINARDAMPNGGTFRIRTRNGALDEDYCAVSFDATPGDYVLLTVSDTGHGMERDVVDRIFEPFYSTKKPGQGTGLGLAMVFGIVKGHGGHITCHSEIGVGTEFCIYLPVISQVVTEEETSQKEGPVSGTETLLLVDDEKLIRDLGTRLLTSVGYKILSAEHGKEALEIYQEIGSEIALVILDLIMPVMGGKECLDALLTINPEVKVLIASGIVAAAESRDLVQNKAKGFVSKPFEKGNLLKAVREILDAE